jgi:hypothetical protein
MVSVKWLALPAMCVVLNGCAAVVAGGIFYDHAKDRESKTAFTSDFRKQNLEREKAGLQPLDWCTELYRTKQSWHDADATCTKKSGQQAPEPSTPDAPKS